MKKLTSLMIAIIFFAACNENSNESIPLLNDKLLYSQFVNSQSFKSLGVSKTDLSDNGLVDQSSGVVRMLIKFKNSDLDFVIAKFNEKGQLIVGGLVRVIPKSTDVNSIDIASNDFQSGKFNGDIIVKLSDSESSKFNFVNSIEQPSTTNARVNGGCGLGDSLYRIGQMGWGGKIGCFIGFIGCLVYNYIDCVTE